MRVATYARVSSESQEARGNIGSQLEALREKLSQLGHEIFEEYKDDGYSGGRLDRPGLDALRDAAELGLFEQVWCLTPDRLARNYAYQIVVTDELARHGVEVHYLDAPPLRDDAEATLLVQVQGVIAEYEKTKIAERNRRGRLFRARAGEIVYRLVPYGYRRIPRGAAGPAHLEVYEPEAEVVRGIFQDFVAGGYSMRRICRRLYEDGIFSPTGNSAWSIACLSKMLSNSTYVGRALYNRHQALPPTTGRRSTRNKLRAPEEWIEIRVPAIVDEEVFEAAQRVSREHSYFSPRRSQPDQWLLRRLVVCGHCGVKTHCQGTVGSSGRELRYYVCNRRRSLEAGGPERACPQPSTRAEALDTLVWEHVCAALMQPQILLKGEAALDARAPRPDDELLTVQLCRLDRRLQQTETERRRVGDLYQMGAIELAEFKSRHQEVVGRHQKLKQERDELVARRKDLTANNRLASRIEDFASQVRQGIEALGFEERQRLLRLLVEEVRVTGPEVQIHLRIPLDEPPLPPDPSGDKPPDRPSKTDLSSHFRLRSLDLDLVDPGRVGGREMDLVARMPNQPAADERRLVGARVIEDEMHVEAIRDLAFDVVEEATELNRTMPAVQFSNHSSAGHIESSEERGGAVAAVIMGAQLRRSGAHRKDRLGSVQSLDLSLLVSAKHKRSLRRIEVQTDDVAHLLNELGVVGELEGVDPVRLELERLPDPPNGGRAQPARLGHGARTPMGGVARGRLQSLGDHRLDGIVGDAARCSRARFVEQAADALFEESRPPLADRVVRDSQLLDDGRVGHSGGAIENDLGAHRQRPRSLRSGGPALQSHEILGADNQILFGAAAMHSGCPPVRIWRSTILSRTSGAGH